MEPGFRWSDRSRRSLQLVMERVEQMADTLDDLAAKYSVSVEAVEVLREALRRGGGRQAQFSHRDLGGMGQWSAGGMTQVGDMFNVDLKDKVNALCTALSRQGEEVNGPPPVAEDLPKPWWPEGLGRPSSTGSQNGMHYACFPDARRVAVKQAEIVTLYDSGDHRISGVSQSQSTTQQLSFSSQNGRTRASDLPIAPAQTPSQ
jgi:hypothetical protein